MSAKSGSDWHGATVLAHFFMTLYNPREFRSFSKPLVLTFPVAAFLMLDILALAAYVYCDGNDQLLRFSTASVQGVFSTASVQAGKPQAAQCVARVTATLYAGSTGPGGGRSGVRVIPGPRQRCARVTASLCAGPRRRCVRYVVTLRSPEAAVCALRHHFTRAHYGGARVTASLYAGPLQRCARYCIASLAR